MSYEIHFQDKTSVVVPTEKGEYLKEKLLASKQVMNLEINGELYRSNQITSIKHAADPRPVADESHQIAGPAPRPGEAGSGCRGERSIQNEINQIIKAEYPGSWAKRIGRPKVREAIRQKLREKDPNWCDSKAGTCVCNNAQLTMASTSV